MDQIRVIKYPSVESISSEESTPSEESIPSEESTPSEESIPSEESTPAEESTPTEDTTPAEETTTFNDDFERLEALYKPILDELLLDAIWDVCFDVHRAAQHEIYKEGKNLDGHGKTVVDGHGKAKSKTCITCPHCSKELCALKYTTHLYACYAGGGRTSFRNARNKLTEERHSEEEEDTVEKSKKSRKKQGRKTKSSNREQSSSKPNLTLEDLKGMSYEKREEFFSKYCGAISKKTTLCKNSHNCKNHTDEARRDIRFLLGISADKTTNDEQIDVDTVDEGNNANLVKWF